MKSVFDSVFGDLFGSVFENSGFGVPKPTTSKIKLTPQQAVIAIELPGILPADVKVWWEGEKLHVEAIDNRGDKPRKISEAYYLHGDNRAETKASLFNGVLTIAVPRTVVGTRVIKVPVQS